ncbi:MAG: polyprenyl synthetase family protein [Candidatus Brocadiaceae bacterium]|nr:polyprenyl synthetase family protein [Candidatus Brocadiaceae bacterium]
MDRKIHFERMRETSRVVIPLIKNAYTKIGLQNHSLLDSLNVIVNKRTNTNQCLLRPYLVRLGFELTGGNNWIDIAPACAAVEIFNISTYQANIAFDNKIGICSDLQKNNQFISSMVSLELATNTIRKLEENYGDKLISRIVDRFHIVNRDIYIGQFNDLNVLTINNLNLSMPEDEYLSLYLQRCENLSGNFVSLCFEIGCLLGGCDDYLITVLKKIGIILGIAGQIVNDLSDFIPNNNFTEVYKSYHSDIKMGKITYPIFCLLKNSSDEQKLKLLNILNQQKQIDISEIKTIVEYWNQSESIRKIRKLILSLHKELKKEIRKIKKTEHRNFLSLAFSILSTNKYLASFRSHKLNGENFNNGN